MFLIRNFLKRRKCNLFAPKHLRLIKKLFKSDCAFKIEVEVGNVVVVFFRKGKNRSSRRKASGIGACKRANKIICFM